MRLLHQLLLGFAFMLFAVAITNASCGTDYWQGNVNNSWGFGLNWSLGYVPLACDAAVLPDPIHGEGASAEIYTGGTYTVDSLQIGTSLPSGLTVDTGGTLTVNSDLVVGPGGILVSNGLLEVNGTGYLGSSGLVGGSGFLFQHDLHNTGSLNGFGGVVEGDFYNTGTTIGGLSLTVNGVFHNSNTLNIGYGTQIVTPEFDNQGSVRFGPGAVVMSIGSGTPSFGNGYFQYVNGTLDEHIASLHAFGTIQNAVLISLDGTLNIELDNGFTPSVGSIFTILEGFTVTGEFADVQGKYFNNGTEMWDVLYTTNSVELEAIPAATPEESSLLLLGSGILGTAVAVRRRLNF